MTNTATRRSAARFREGARRLPLGLRLAVLTWLPALLALSALGWLGAREMASTHRIGAARRLLADLQMIAADLPAEPSTVLLARRGREHGVRLWLVEDRTGALGSPLSGRVTGHVGETGVELLVPNRSSVEHVRARVQGPPGVRWSALHGAAPLSDLGPALAAWWGGVALAALLALGVAGVLGAWLARRLRGVNRALDHAVGGLPSRAGPVAAATLARDRLELLHREQQTLAARHEQLRWVLASMIEGVIVVGPDELVVFVNPAAETLLGLDSQDARKRPLTELVRSLDLQQVVAEAREAGTPIERELVLRGKQERSLQVHCSPVRAPGRASIGMVLVFNDVTRLRRLERVRRDFVANVSHEIRTPITTIAGFVETLLEGALGNPAEAENFLKIIKRHADRLNAIVEDLLMLARVEQEDERSVIRLEIGSLSEVLAGAVEACRFKAEGKEIDLRLAVPVDVRAAVNAPLLEQAVVNLIDNAIKYSEPGSAVHVTAAAEANGVRIDVRDDGVGVAASDLPRLFERFYRVDRARSRKLGGTGLGLAIVKHVAQVHGGRASVVSTLGRGSTFSIHLPDEELAVEERSVPID